MRGKILAVCLVWLSLLGIGSLVYKYWYKPVQEHQEQVAVQQNEKQKLESTSSSSRYDHTVSVALDSFSGYAVVRSQDFQNYLSNKRIKINLNDDGADYTGRLQALRSGHTQIAVFTIDALVKATAELQKTYNNSDLPASIVAIIDESRGADAMVGYTKAIPNIDALNDPNIKIYAVENSPSETLARVVMAHFNLTNVNQDALVYLKDAEAVYKRYRSANQDDKSVYILWEPYVTKVLENPNTHTIVDSSRFRGFIVDVIVANRDYLFKNPDVVSAFVESYFRAFYQHRGTMVQLVLDDSKGAGSPLSQTQAERLVKEIWWNNTQENYAHFGLLQGRPLQHVEDMISNITNVLLRSRAIDSDPTGGKPNLLYYDKTLHALQERNFYPGVDVENIRDDTVILPSLTDMEWDRLVPVGTLEVPPLVFARGTSILTDQSTFILDDIVEKLKNWPQYYLLIRGNASLKGDLEANKALAKARAKAAEKYLVDHGIGNHRVKAIGVDPNGNTSVTFVLGQTPY